MAIKISDLNPEYSNSESYLYEVSDDEMLNTVGGWWGWRWAVAGWFAGYWWARKQQQQPQPPMGGGEEFEG